MKLDIDEVVKLANIRYAERKQAKGIDLRYTAPELFPRICSDQVLALAEVLVELINAQHEEKPALKGWTNDGSVP